jgi:hypothetical protein
MKNKQMEKRFLLIVGAGASSSFGVPTMRDFVLEFLGTSRLVKEFVGLSGKVTGVYTELEKGAQNLCHIQDSLQCHFIKIRNSKDYVADNDDIEEVIKFLIPEVKKGDDLASALLDQIKTLILEKCGSYNDDLAQSVYDLLLDKISRFTPGFDICTTNYDLILEKVFEKHEGKYHLIDGFGYGEATTEYYWNPLLFDIDTTAEGIIRLFKVHGSVDWKADPQKNLITKLSSTVDVKLKAIQIQQKIEDLLIWPLPVKERMKQVGEKPFNDVERRVTECFKRQNLNLIILGHSLRDKWIDELVRLSVQKYRSNLWLIDPNPPDNKDYLEGFESNIIRKRFGEDSIRQLAKKLKARTNI